MPYAARATVDVRTATLHDLTGLPPLDDAKHGAPPIEVTRLGTRGHRTGTAPWVLAYIEVWGTTGPENAPIARHYRSGVGPVWLLGDAPEWLRALALHALTGEPVAMLQADGSPSAEHSCLTPADGEETLTAVMAVGDRPGYRENCRTCGQAWVVVDRAGFLHWTPVDESGPR